MNDRFVPPAGVGLLALSRTDLLKTGALIGGQWIASRGGVFAVDNPTDGAVIAEVADCGAPEAAAALDAAAKAFASWRDVPAPVRAAKLRAWFEAMTLSAEDLAKLVSLESGKPLAEARGEVAYAASYLEWFAEEARRSSGEILASPSLERDMLVTREPVGVVAVLTPWNFPAAMIARKLAPALAAGCTVVAKPAEDTPLSALALAVLAEEAGIPPGVINMVPASRARAPEVAQVWLDDFRVRKISFTGSTAVGKLLAKGSADTLKRLSLELGGDAPFIVFDDADLDVAVDALLKAKFRNAGQACVAANRVLVQAGIHDAFLEKLTAAVRALSVGAAADGPADMGALINGRAVDKVDGLVRAAVADGARVLVGGERHALGGNFYAPTVVAGVSPRMRLSCEEIFGPVVAITRFGEEDEAIALANASRFGLAAYICSSDMKRARRVARQLETGMVGINEGMLSSAVAPFGGIKESGYGREGSVHGLAEYQSLKYVCISALD